MIYLYDSVKKSLTKMGNLKIKKSSEFYSLDEYGNKKFVYHLLNDNYIIGYYKSIESARAMLETIINIYLSPLTSNDYHVIYIEDDFEKICEVY